MRRRAALARASRTFEVRRGVGVVETTNGVTLESTDGISRGETVVMAPFGSWATRSAAFAESNGPRAFLATFGERTVRETVALAMSLLNERKNAPDDSSAYARTLPETFDFVDACLTERHLTALDGTVTAARLRKRGDFVRALASSTGLMVKDVSWAIGAVSSHAMKSEIVPYALVPGCDLLDHSTTPNCVVRRDETTNDVFCASTRDVAPGEKLTISYGKSLCNDRALRMYGFASRELYSNDARVLSGGFRGVHPSNEAFDASVDESEKVFGGRKAALDAWRLEKDTFEDADVADGDAEWFRAATTLRRGQTEIIEAYIRALE